MGDDGTFEPRGDGEGEGEDVKTITQQQKEQRDMRWSLLLLLSFGIAILIANMYYCQPLLEDLRTSFGVTTEEIGTVPALTQGGYTVGLAFVTPLGDLLPRKALVTSLTALCTILTLGLSLCRSLATFQALSFLDILLLTDTDAPLPSPAWYDRLPTRHNLVKAFEWLVDGVGVGGSLVFYFSGHSTTLPDTDGDELGLFDQAIKPCDYLTNGVIVDDEMYRALGGFAGSGGGGREWDQWITYTSHCWYKGNISESHLHHLPDVIQAQDLGLSPDQIPRKKSVASIGDLIGSQNGAGWGGGGDSTASTTASVAASVSSTPPSSPLTKPFTPVNRKRSSQKSKAAFKATLELKLSKGFAGRVSEGHVLQFSSCLEDQASGEVMTDVGPRSLMTHEFIHDFEELPDALAPCPTLVNPKVMRILKRPSYAQVLLALMDSIQEKYGELFDDKHRQDVQMSTARLIAELDMPFTL
ncbi:hypothetical protein HDU93_001839 [Gonapodya sp. JEL0774]|nr:hypothetical protein HDU93_001839 [Gonapodya sp. JEL0774]